MTEATDEDSDEAFSRTLETLLDLTEPALRLTEAYLRYAADTKLNVKNDVGADSHSDAALIFFQRARLSFATPPTLDLDEQT